MGGHIALMEKTIIILWKKTRSLSFKTHSDRGFEEPIFSWVPSIAPSQLITVDKNFSKKWGKTVLLSSLKGRSLFRLSFDKI